MSGNGRCSGTRRRAALRLDPDVNRRRMTFGLDDADGNVRDRDFGGGWREVLDARLFRPLNTLMSVRAVGLLPFLLGKVISCICQGNHVMRLVVLPLPLVRQAVRQSISRRGETEHKCQ